MELKDSVVQKLAVVITEKTLQLAYAEAQREIVQAELRDVYRQLNEALAIIEARDTTIALLTELPQDLVGEEGGMHGSDSTVDRGSLASPDTS